jgi:hypothetical protein
MILVTCGWLKYLNIAFLILPNNVITSFSDEYNSTKSQI